MLTPQSIEWLTANKNIWERQKIGNHKYLDDSEKKQLQAIAKEIDPDRYFTLYGCDGCIHDLIKFVFTVYDAQTVPSNTPTAKKVRG
jgi:hypothetical protein